MEEFVQVKIFVNVRMGMSENSVKNHFYSTIRRNLRRHRKLVQSAKLTVKDVMESPELLELFLRPSPRKSRQNSQSKKGQPSGDETPKVERWTGSSEFNPALHCLLTAAPEDASFIVPMAASLFSTGNT